MIPQPIYRGYPALGCEICQARAVTDEHCVNGDNGPPAVFVIAAKAVGVVWIARFQGFKPTPSFRAATSSSCNWGHFRD